VDSILAVARALGADIHKLDDVDAALVRRRHELWNRVVEPVVVAWGGKVDPIVIRTPEKATGSVKHSLTVENSQSRVSRTSVSKLFARKALAIGGVRYLERELHLEFKNPIPPGYHELTIEWAGKTHSTMIISAPVKAYFPFKQKEWGIFAPIYSLHSARNPNAGDLADFKSIAGWMRVHGGRVAGTLPLLASFLDQPFEPSPYSPASRLFWNEFYAHTAQSRRASNGDRIDYANEMKFRRSILEKDAKAFFQANANTRERALYDEFLKAESELIPYARFRAVTEKQKSGWPAWPGHLKEGRIRPSDYDAHVEQYHLYAQWRVQSQLRSLAGESSRNETLLYLDLPLGLSPAGYDIWRYPHLFVRDVAGGAPPDPVFTKGQNWAFPPMHPESQRLDRYAYTIAYLRNHLAHRPCDGTAPVVLDSQRVQR